MDKVVLNEALRSMLGDLSHPFNIYDESGRIVLVVTPTRRKSLYDGEDTHLSEDEINCRIAEGGRELRGFLSELEASQN